MPQWKNVDQANGAPISGVEAKVTANGEVMFGNVTSDSFITGKSVGVFGVSAAETANAAAAGVTHAGWVKLTQGTGPVLSITVTANGTSGYTNGAVTISAGGPGGNAAATQVTNGSGQITAVNVTNGGSGFITAPTVTPNGAGSGATLTAVVGGRANRKNWETLVAMGSISGDASDDTTLPDA